MSRATALVDNGEALPGQMLTHGWILPPGITQDRWAEVGLTIQGMHRSINFWVGDWYLFGEDAFGQDAAQQMSGDLDMGDESLKQAIWVAERFPLDKRQPRLSWSHHRIAAGLEPPLRYEILALAAEPTPVWPTRRLQEYIDGMLVNLTPEGEASETQPASNKAGPADLTEEALEAMIQGASIQGPHDVTSFGQGWVEALRWKRHREHFTRWVD